MTHAHAALESVLHQWVNQPASREFFQTPDFHRLLDLELAAEPTCRAFGITPENAVAALQRRSHLLQTLYPALNTFCCDHLGWSTCPLATLWTLWLPLVLQLQQLRTHLNRPLIQGILGGQGTGKSTLVAILAFILHQLGCSACCLSLDDLYKTYAERQQLQQSDPRLRWRGPPGTHDVQLGWQVLQQFRANRLPVWVPRFDKSAYDGLGDRNTPEQVTQADIVFFEGWFVGVRPIAPEIFDTAPAPIVTAADRAFARDINAKLYEYLPLWKQLDRLIVLYPQDYRISQQWRLQAEQQMKAAGRSGMSDDEIYQFVEYFWRSLHPDLFIQPMLHLGHADLAIEVGIDHSPRLIYSPQQKTAA
jgi:D-glycerate 3-kinase